jgi:hypothetical protein
MLRNRCISWCRDSWWAAWFWVEERSRLARPGNSPEVGLIPGNWDTSNLFNVCHRLFLGRTCDNIAMRLNTEDLKKCARRSNKFW